MKDPLKTCQTLPLDFESKYTAAGENPFFALCRRIKRWHQRRRNRLILSALSDDQLKDIGLSRGELEPFDDKN